MATSFASAADLAARLKRPMWDGADLEQVETFLDDAANDLRNEIGWHIYPPVTVTVDVEPDFRGCTHLPGAPIVGVSSVTQSGSNVPSGTYEWAGGILRLPGWGRASVTYTVGYSEPPPELIKWTCVLAAQALALSDDGDLAATPSSRSLADYRISYSERQQLGDLPIPDRVLERLRSTYGTGVYST